MHLAVILQSVKILFFTRSLRYIVSQNLHVESLNQFYIFLARQYALLGHSAYFRNHYRRLSHLRAKYGKSPLKNFVDFHCATTQIFTECFDLVQISQHNGNYRIIPFYWYVLCIGTLLCWHAYDVMFMGCNSHFGMQKNYTSATTRNTHVQYKRPIPFRWKGIAKI